MKFLEDILSNKSGLGECKRAQLNLNCSAILSRTLSPKLEDPGKLTIPYTLGKVIIKKVLYDLGASVNLIPRTIFKQMRISELKPTRMTIQLADASVRLLLGIVEDVPVQVEKFFVSGDFMVMEIEEDKKVPIIIGKPFLRITRVIANMREDTLTIRVEDE
jgi:hypothetical protein